VIQKRIHPPVRYSFSDLFSNFWKFSLRYSHSSASTKRGVEIYTLSSFDFASTVNSERRLSIHTPLTNIYTNKLSLYAIGAVEKYIERFLQNYYSPMVIMNCIRHFFIRELYLYWYSLFTCRICYLFFYNKKTFSSCWVWLSLHLSQRWWVIPVCPMVCDRGYFPLLMIVIVWVFMRLVRCLLPRNIEYCLQLYWPNIFVLFINFINIYFFRYPIYNAEAPNLVQEL